MECLAETPCPGQLGVASTQFFTLMLSALVKNHCDLEPRNLYSKNYGDSLNDGDRFDFIVIGSGSGGSTVAGRLAEHLDWKVLLLEAGDYPSSDTEIPGIFFKLQNTEEDWIYRTEPDDACKGFTNEACSWPRGKVLGGSSAINGMIYVEGNDRDYDNWRDLGNTGWDFDSLKLYFEKIRNTLKPTNFSYPSAIREVMTAAAAELGLTGDGYLNYRSVETTIVNGRRNSAAKAYLAPIKDSKNFFLSLKSTVTKVLIDGDKAVGVEVKIGDKLIRLNADKEVILSAGSVNSPQILINSGIGPKAQLEALNIQPVKFLDVGENLQDHPVLVMYMKVNQSQETDIEPIDILHDYINKKEGPLASVDLLTLAAFINTRKNSDYPNIQFHHLRFPRNDRDLLPDLIRQVGFNAESTRSILDANKVSDLVAILSVLMVPKSIGRITLASSDPFDKPKIYPNYLQDEDDVNVFLESIDVASDLLRTDALKGSEFLEFPVPNCKEIPFGGRDYWKCYVKNFVTTLYHPVGTCKMGNDRSAVVNDKLQVHGIDNLRVIDASVMPVIVSGNTNIPTILIGEKGADMIKSRWNKSS